MKTDMFFRRFLSVAAALFLTLQGSFAQTISNSYLKGLELFNLGDMDRAASLFMRALSENSEDDASHYYLSQIELERGDEESSMEHLLAAAAIDSTNTQYLTELAERYYARKDFDNSLKYLVKVEEMTGQTLQSSSMRFELLRATGKFDEAMELLTKLNKVNPNPQSCFILGEWHASRYQDSLALQYYDETLQLDSDYDPAYYGKAEVCRRRNDIRGYFDNLNVFMASENIDSGVKADSLEQVVFNPNMVSSFKAQVASLVLLVLQAHPEDTTANFMAASYFFRTDRPDYGLGVYQKNLNSFPHEERSYTQLASALYYLERWDYLIKVLGDALKEFPDSAGFTEFLAIAYWKAERRSEALETYNKLSRMLPKNSVPLLHCYAAMGDLYQDSGQTQKAFKYYDKALKINPDYVPVLNNYAYHLSLLGSSLDKALRMSEKTIVAEPENANYLDTYGWIQYLMGKNEMAKVTFKKVMVYGGQDCAVCLMHFAEVLNSLKEYDLAILYYERAMKKDPSLNLTEKINSLRNRGK